MVGRKAGKGLAIVGQAPAVVERRDAAENRRKILSAARKLLRDRPIQEICMDEVARTAGVGKGTVYRRFADRSSLCRALLHDDATDLQNASLADFGLPGCSPWGQRTRKLLSALFDFHMEHASLLNEARSCDRGNRFEHPAHAWQRTTLAAYLKQAAKAHEIEPLEYGFTADLVLAGLDPELLTLHRAHDSSQSKLRDVFLESARRTFGFRPLD